MTVSLDITAYSNLRHVGDHNPPSQIWCENEDHITAFAYDDFPHALQAVPRYGIRTGSGGSRFIYGGCFEITDKTETIGFRAGSYSGYGRWREDLQEQFNPDRSPGLPFYELIWFADNEGTLDEVAAMSLLADFREHEAMYRARRADDEYGRYDIERYEHWMRACELASQGGLIEFH